MTALMSRSKPKPPFATMEQWHGYNAALDFLNWAYDQGAWIGERDEDGRLFALDVKQVLALAEQWARERGDFSINRQTRSQS